MDNTFQSDVNDRLKVTYYASNGVTQNRLNEALDI